MIFTEQQNEQFIATLTSLGGSAGNQRLMEALGWQDGTYQQIKQQLIDAGRIRPGRGRGGSVALATAAQTPLARGDLPEPKPAPVKAAPAAPNLAPVSELDYADKLWKTADKLRGNMEPATTSTSHWA